MSRVCPCCVLIFAVTMMMVMGGCSNSGSSSSSSSSPIAVSLSPSSAKTIDQPQTVNITASLVNDRSFSGLTWTLTGQGSLSSSTGQAVTYTPPTTTLTSQQQVTITATSVADQTKSASLQITVNPPPQISIAQLNGSGSVGEPYSQTIAITGGSAPFQWSVYNGPILTGFRVGGAVPDGLALNPATGVISGTPTNAGTWYFDVNATDAAGVTAINPFFSIQIDPVPQSVNPIPFLNQTLVPMAVAPGGANIPLNVSGTGFVSGASIHFNGTPLITGFIDSEHLTAILNGANTAKAGTASVTVINPAPGGGSSNVVYFQVGAPEATVNFANAPNSPLQISQPLFMAAADFNEDGTPDLAIATGPLVETLLGNADGTFAPSAGSPLELPSPPYEDFATPLTGPIVAGDFNNSGHMGLAVGEVENEAAVIFLGNGHGTFALSSANFADAFGGPISALVPADFNGDGNLDLAITNQVAGQSPVVLGYGDGAFSLGGALSPPTIPITGMFPTGVAVGDFNTDGKLDAIVASAGNTINPASGTIVSIGNGKGTFTRGSVISFGQSLFAIVTADFNGDGKLDVAVTDSGSNAVLVLLGNGDGTFGAPTTFPVGSEPGAMAAGDFNNDGKLDLAIANFGDNTITLLLSNGDGTFTASSGSPYPVGQEPTSIVAADFNGDGKLDLAVANVTDNTVSILLQQ